jgi:hypothetical protein
VSLVSSKVAPTTTETVYAVLRAMMQSAVNADPQVIPANPCTRIKLPKAGKRVVEPLPAAAIVALHDAITPPLPGYRSTRKSRPGPRSSHQWRKVHGDEWLTSNQLRLSADIASDAAGRAYDRWDGLFRTDGRGYPVSAKSLGKLLTGQIDRYRGSYVLRSQQDRHSKVRTWRVEEWSG